MSSSRSGSIFLTDVDQSTPRTVVPHAVTPMVQRPPITGIPASSSTSSLHSASTPQARAPRPVFPNAAVEAAASSPSLGSTHKSFAKPSPTKSDHGTHAAEQALAASAQSGVAMSAATMAVLSAQLKTSSLQERLLRMRETDVKLEDTKKKFGTAMDVIKSGQDQFRLKQKEMRDTISQFEKFVIDQDNKIVKAEKTAEQEAKIVAQHRATISGLVKTISEKRAEKTRIEHDLRRLARNRQYLVSVVHEMAPDGDDDDPSRVISRHTLLLGEQTNLEKRSTELETELERLQNEFAVFKKAKMNEILVTNSALAVQNKQLETTVSTAADIEADLKIRHSKASSTAGKISQLELAIRNVYARVCDSYTERRPRFVEPDTTIENAEARSQDLIKRILAACMERYSELDDMLKQWHKEQGNYINRTVTSPAAAQSPAATSRRKFVDNESSGLDTSALQMNLKSLNSSQMRLSISGPPSLAPSAQPSARKPA